MCQQVKIFRHATGKNGFIYKKECIFNAGLPMFARNKINIYDYSDYRKFLSDFYELEKSLDPTFSYRVFAAAMMAII